MGASEKALFPLSIARPETETCQTLRAFSRFPRLAVGAFNLRFKGGLHGYPSLVARACSIPSLFAGIIQLAVSRVRKASEKKRSGWIKS